MFQTVHYLWAVCVCAVLADEDLHIDLSLLDARAVGQPSRGTGDLVNEWDIEDEANPEELGEYLQGDILFPVSATTRNGLQAASTRWPNGKIPYEIKGDFDAFQMQTIESALNDYHNKTCIKFVRRSGKENDYISITGDNTGCWSSVGRIGGKQALNLQPPACLKRKGTIVHELMHAVGFLHEQSREDRDKHINIQWNNIQKSHEHNFDKAAKHSTDDFKVSYDYSSVMHYSAKAFSANGKPTIVPRTKAAIGQRVGFSKGDVKKINRMYKCTL